MLLILAIVAVTHYCNSVLFIVVGGYLGADCSFNPTSGSTSLSTSSSTSAESPNTKAAFPTSAIIGLVVGSVAVGLLASILVVVVRSTKKERFGVNLPSRPQSEMSLQIEMKGSSLEYQPLPPPPEFEVSDSSKIIDFKDVIVQTEIGAGELKNFSKVFKENCVRCFWHCFQSNLSWKHSCHQKTQIGLGNRRRRDEIIWW